MNYTLIFTGNDSTMSELERGDDGSSKNHWLSLLLLPLIMVGVVGNILVCMAVTMEKRLQSVTNYFLLSLAITDLLVCIVVWPFSILHEFMGKLSRLTFSKASSTPLQYQSVKFTLEYAIIRTVLIIIILSINLPNLGKLCQAKEVKHVSGLHNLELHIRPLIYRLMIYSKITYCT